MTRSVDNPELPDDAPAPTGYTLQLPTGDQHLLTRGALFDRIRGLLGGRAAEELALGEVSTGAENDLELATKLARSVVGRFGMGESVRLLHCAQPQASPGSPETVGLAVRDCSERTASLLDEEAENLLDQLYEDAKQLLGQHKDALERVAAALVDRESWTSPTLSPFSRGRPRRAIAVDQTPPAPFDGLH